MFQTLKYQFKIPVIAIVLLASACAHSNDPRQERLEKKFVRNMQVASVWIIENGIPAYMEMGYDELWDLMRDKWTVMLTSEPRVVDHHNLAQFWIYARRINYDIRILHREIVDGQFYEFWFIKVVPYSGSGETDRLEFFVTKADEIFGHREILLKSNQFIATYAVNDDVVISFPVDSLHKLEIMEAWEYPQHFENTNLPDIRVKMTRDGPVRVKCFLGICREVSN